MSTATADIDLCQAHTRSLSLASGLPLRSFPDEHVRARVGRALAREDVDSVDALLRLLRTNAEARTRFRRSIAISTTGLFRDPAQFEVLEGLLPPLLGRARRTWIWSAGCSDGSELASVALVLERLGALEHAFLLGSDLLEENICKARSGAAFPASVAARLRWEQRDVVAAGAPAGRWDIVLCRNVAIYLTPEARAALHATIAQALAPDGILLLGRSERLASPQTLGLELVAPHAYRKSHS